MPRRVRNPGTGKPPTGLPASGIPAGGGFGPGWGGPAKGKRAGPRQGAFAKGNTVGFVAGKPETFTHHHGLGDPALAEERKRLAASKEEQLEQMRQVWGDVALNSPNDMAKITAAEKLYDRLDGKPRQVNENQNRDMTLEKMVADAAKQRTRHPE